MLNTTTPPFLTKTLRDLRFACDDSCNKESEPQAQLVYLPKVTLDEAFLTNPTNLRYYA